MVLPVISADRSLMGLRAPFVRAGGPTIPTCHDPRDPGAGVTIRAARTARAQARAFLGASSRVAAQSLLTAAEVVIARPATSAASATSAGSTVPGRPT